VAAVWTEMVEVTGKGNSIARHNHMFTLQGRFSYTGSRRTTNTALCRVVE